MPPTLRRRDHVALVLHRTGAQQQFPMRLPGAVGEGRGHGQQVARRRHQGAVQLGEAQVVADAQADAVRRRPDGRVEGDWQRTGAQNPALVVVLAPVQVAEQVDLVVARGQRAVGGEHAACVEDTLGIVGPDRQRAADQPHPVFAGRRAEHVLDRPGTGDFGDRQLVALVVAHEAEVLRQRDQVGTLARGLRDQTARGVEVAFDAGTRHHLDSSDLHAKAPVRGTTGPRRTGRFADSPEPQGRPCVAPGCGPALGPSTGSHRGLIAARRRPAQPQLPVPAQAGSCRAVRR